MSPTEINVYHYRRDLDVTEVCGLGEKHKVYFHEVKKLTLVSQRSVYIEALHYTHGGMGIKQTWMDAQGRFYTRQEGWDGWSNFMRDGGKAFSVRPFLAPAKSLAGKLI